MLKPIEPLDDTDPMPFGKHKGIPMQDVPAAYLHWLWTNGKRREMLTCRVADHIWRNMSALQSEHKDGIWE